METRWIRRTFIRMQAPEPYGLGTEYHPDGMDESALNWSQPDSCSPRADTASVSILSCDKIPDINSVKEERLVWLTVSEVSVYACLSPLLLGLWQSRNLIAEGCGKESCSPVGSQEAEHKGKSQRRRGQRPDTVCSVTPHDLLLSTGLHLLNLYHLQIMPLNYSFISILIYRWH